MSFHEKAYQQGFDRGLRMRFTVMSDRCSLVNVRTSISARRMPKQKRKREQLNRVEKSKRPMTRVTGRCEINVGISLLPFDSVGQTDETGRSPAREFHLIGAAAHAPASE